MKKDSPAGRYFAKGILDPECLTAGGIAVIHEGQHTTDPATGERHTGVDVAALTAELRESARRALDPGAGTAAMEHHLWSSAMLLQNLAVVWAMYATRAECTEQLDIYARLALKAQNQQRQTLRTLAEFWPAALQVLRSGFATPGVPVLPFTAELSGCPFVPVFRRDFPGRSIIQALVTFPEGPVSSFGSILAEAIHFLKPCDPMSERTFPVFVDRLNIRD